MGASRRDVLQWVLGRGLAPVAVGLALVFTLLWGTTATLLGQVLYDYKDWVEKIAGALKAQFGKINSNAKPHLLGPAAAPLEKLRGQYRYQVLLKASPQTQLSSVQFSFMTQVKSEGQLSAWHSP